MRHLTSLCQDYLLTQVTHPTSVNNQIPIAPIHSPIAEEDRSHPKCSRYRYRRLETGSRCFYRGRSLGIVDRRFVAQIKPPLRIGTLMLEDCSTVQGFLCESYAVAGAIDISHLGR